MCSPPSPLHISLAIPIPIKTCLQIERLFKNFLWSSGPDKKRCNLVNWEKVCLPKAEGGIGLCRVKEFNDACLLKLGWSAVTTDSLWASWFRGRYFRHSPIWFSGNTKAGSCIWKKIRSLATLLQQGSHWVLGNGHSIQLWLDNWIDHDPIAKRFPLLHFFEMDLVVDITQGLSWSIPDSIPAEVRSFLIQKTELIPLSHSVPDKLSWIGHASGALSLKSAWNTLRSSREAIVWSGLAWNKIINPRLSCFSWRLLLRKTPTDTLVMHTGCSMASRCYSCYTDSESDLHLLSALAMGVDSPGMKTSSSNLFPSHQYPLVPLQ